MKNTIKTLALITVTVAAVKAFKRVDKNLIYIEKTLNTIQKQK